MWAVRWANVPVCTGPGREVLTWAVGGEARRRDLAVRHYDHYFVVPGGITVATCTCCPVNIYYSAMHLHFGEIDKIRYLRRIFLWSWKLRHMLQSYKEMNKLNIRHWPYKTKKGNIDIFPFVTCFWFYLFFCEKRKLSLFSYLYLLGKIDSYFTITFFFMNLLPRSE